LIKDNNIEFPIGRLYEDVYFSIIAYTKAKKITVLPLGLYFWRIREGSTTKSFNNEVRNLEDRVYIFNEVINYFDKNKIAKNFIDDFLDRMFRNVFLFYLNNLEYKDKDLLLEYTKFLNPIINEYESFIVNNIRVQDKLKYYYLKNNDIDSLIRYLEELRNAKEISFNIEELHGLTFNNKQNNLLKYEFKDRVYCIKEDVCENKYLIENTRYIYNPFVYKAFNDCNNKSFNITFGFAFYNFDINFKDFKVITYLENIDSRQEILIDNEIIKVNNEEEYCLINNTISYDMLDENSRYNIVAKFFNGNYSIQFYIMSPIGENKNVKPFYQFYTNDIFQVNYNLLRLLCLSRSEVKRIAEVKSIKDNVITLNMISNVKDENLYLRNREADNFIYFDGNTCNIKKMKVDISYFVKSADKYNVEYSIINNIDNENYFLDIDKDYFLLIKRTKKGEIELIKLSKSFYVKEIETTMNSISILLDDNIILNKKIKIFIKGKTKEYLSKIKDGIYVLNLKGMSFKEKTNISIQLKYLDERRKNIDLYLKFDNNTKISSNIKLKKIDTNIKVKRSLSKLLIKKIFK
jgi:hypothetical protein